VSRIALVTGGAGFIGSHLVDALLSAGWSVRVVDDFTTGFVKNLDHVRDDIELLCADIRNHGILAPVMEGVDTVFHLAALPSVPRSVRMPLWSNGINIDGTVKVLENARNLEVRRVVFSSSSSVYGDTEVLPKIESMPSSPLSPYALQKHVGEEYCRLYHSLYGLETVALRYFNVFGPRQDPNSDYAAVIPRFIAAARTRVPPVIYGDGEQTRDFTYVDNVVEANLLAADAERAPGRVMNIAAGSSTTVNDLWDAISTIVGTDVKPEHVAPRVGDVRDSLADLTLASDLLGYTPKVGVCCGLENTIE
jgi:UDP-glucose 4-epimerase